MQIQCMFDTSKIPRTYRQMIVSVIKNCIRLADESYYTDLYETARNGPKPYCFAVFLKNFRMEEKEIHVEGLQLHLTSGDYRFLLTFLNGLQRTKTFRYKTYQLERKQIRMIPERQISSRKMLVKTLSPLLVEDESHIPLAPSDPEYNRHFNAITERLMNTLSGRGRKEEIRITPVAVKKTVVQEQNREFVQRKGEDAVLYFTTYSGRFLLEGHPEDLKWLMDYGGGLRSAQGFGYLQPVMEVT